MARSERARIRVVSAEIQEDGCYLITQRLPTSTLPLHWEFPGGRVRDGESDVQALSRCLRDRLGAACQVGDRLLEVEHAYEGYDLVLVVYRVSLSACPRTRRVHALAWAEPQDFARYPFPGADQKTVDALLSEG